MNNRRFGVEIECGYGGPGAEPECDCRCYCDEYRCYFCIDGCECEAAEEDSEVTECSCECSCEECELCRYGCDGECSYDYYEDERGCDAARRILSDNGFDEWTDHIHPDGSGVEIPSPILQGREGLRELAQVMALLRDNGFDCTRSDGMHVHHDAPEWAEDDSLVAHTVELWEENLPLIRRFVDPSRTTNSMCASHRGGEGSYGTEWQKQQWEQFKQTKDIGIVRDKFRALNINHLQRTGSLELRLHEGTLDFDKAAAWIRFGQGFLDFALKTYKRGQLVTCESRLELLRNARVSSTTRRRLMVAERSAA